MLPPPTKMVRSGPAQAKYPQFIDEPGNERGLAVAGVHEAVEVAVVALVEANGMWM